MQKEFNTLDKKIIKSWRISRAILLILIICISIPVTLFMIKASVNISLKAVFIVAIGIVLAYSVVSFLIYPAIEYRQWGYRVDEDKVVIQHGIFFIKKTIIPIIRIQNITVSQGPINRHFDLYEIEIALASGQFSIKGLDKETSDLISENLKSRLYNRIEKKGNEINVVRS